MTKPDKSQIDQVALARIERMAHGREWSLMQVRPDDYLIVIGHGDVYAVRRCAAKES